MTDTLHPSRLELDRLFLGDAAPGLARHVQGCSECQGYVTRLGAREAVPAWLLALERRGPRSPGRRGIFHVEKIAGPFFFTGGLAAAAVLLGLHPVDRVQPDKRVVFVAALLAIACRAHRARSQNSAAPARAVSMTLRGGRE